MVEGLDLSAIKGAYAGRGSDAYHPALLKFRQFLLRGLAHVSHEWTLVCLAWNFKRMAMLRPKSVQRA